MQQTQNSGEEAGGKISISEPTKEFRVNATFSNGLLW